MAREVHVSIGRDRYQAAAEVGPHRLRADEPGELGGADSGPSPVELLLTSLAACKAITVRMYADRKEWPLERIAAVARVSSMGAHVPEAIEVELRFEGELSDEQRARLLGIAEKCPVQRAITSGVRVESRLAGPG